MNKLIAWEKFAGFIPITKETKFHLQFRDSFSTVSFK